MHRPRLLLFLLALIAAGRASAAPAPAPADTPLIPRELHTDEEKARALREFYTKHELRIPMRDGAHLFTNVYVPKDRSRPYPFILLRTPYGVAPYGVDNYPSAREPHTLVGLAPAPELLRHGFIFVLQDVRGRMMSEGRFSDIRPLVPGKRAPSDVDESTDAYDTIDWLVKNVPNNNGRVGVWGNSYPGFYATMAAVDAHPALKAVSPQMPVTEWFLGDDFHHNGALFLADLFLFMADFGKPRPQPTPVWTWDFDARHGDLYDFFMQLGTLADADQRWVGRPVELWRASVEHPTRDAFWRARDPRPHLRGVRPAVMTVGGWFDSDDLFGTLATYRAIEQQSPGTTNTLVMGPWRHGGQYRTDGESLGDLSFGGKTARFYRESILTPFFLHHLKGQKIAPIPEAWAFETGANEWRTYDAWPPPQARPTPLHFASRGRLLTAPADDAADGTFDSYVSDPRKPVPYRERLSAHRDPEYMVEDQRFAARRPDVLVYATEPLSADVTLAGPIEADLWIETSGTDSDFVVKLIDAFPENAADPDPNPRGTRMGGYQALLRGEVMRGRFRNSFERPEPFTPGVPARVRFTLPDVNHTFRTGHRVMVQVQSSWFPLVDRNPQVFIDIYHARESDFRAATQKLHRGGAHRSTVILPVLRGRL